MPSRDSSASDDARPPAAVSGKADGFSGQRIVVLPRSVVTRALGEPLYSGLLPTDLGWFPAARGHRRERRAGLAEAIWLHWVDGAGWVELRGVRHDVRAGELAVVPPGEPHAYGADDGRPWTLRWCHLAGRDLPDLLAELGADAAAPVCRPGDDSALALVFEEALDALERGYARPQLLRASRAMGHFLARAAWLARRAPEPAPDAGRRIARCIEHMRLHLDRPLRLAELAALTHWSPSHFKARFRAHTGYGCIDYLIRLRVHAACQLLDTTALDIKSVAARVGYPDPLWFSKAFKAIAGVPPSEYRRRAKG